MRWRIHPTLPFLFATLCPSLAFASELAFDRLPNSPAACTITHISWNNGTPPYTLQIFSDSDSTQIYNGITSTTYTWLVNMAATTNVSLSLSDNAGRMAFDVSAFSISPSLDVSCLNDDHADSNNTSIDTFMSEDTVLSVGEIAGIAVGAGIFAIGLGALCVYFFLRRRRKQFRRRQSRIIGA